MADRHRDPPEQNGTDAGEDFLARWSRRKRESNRADVPAEPAGEDPPVSATGTDEGPTDADLPPLDSLGPDSDFSAFLSKNVSEHLRRAALRKLFRQPGFNIRDGLDDYDDDYRSFAALGDTITADMRHHRERLEEKRRAQEEPAPKDARPDSERADADGYTGHGPEREPQSPTSESPDPADGTDQEPEDGDSDHA